MYGSDSSKWTCGPGPGRACALNSLPMPTLERAEADAAFSRGVLERLEAIDPDALEQQDRLTWEILHRKASLNVEALDHYWVITNVLTPYSSGIGGLRALFAMVPVADAQGREDYLRLLAQVPEAVGFVEAHARGQMERGVVVPEPSMDAVVGVVRANTAPFDDGPFPVALVRLGAQREETDAEGDAAAFLAEAARIVEGEINPALERLAAFLDGEYRQAAPAEVGLSRQPGGEAAYRYLVRGGLYTKVDRGLAVMGPTPYREPVHSRLHQETVAPSCRLLGVFRPFGSPSVLLPE